MAATGRERIRVLHVDDDPDFVDLAATSLEGEGDRLTVETATSAREGLGLLHDRPPDCIVSEYDMSGMDGLEFLRAVRDEYPGIPFILFTGEGSEAVASRAISTGVTDYIQKRSGSRRFELLVSRIERAVEQYRTERELERRNDLFRKAQEIATIGAYEYDVTDDELRWTEQVYEMHGVPTDFDPSIEGVAEMYHPEDRPKLREAIDRAITAGRSYDLEVRMTPRNGGQRWLRTVADPQIEDGEVVRVRGTVHDITDRKEREQDLEQYEYFFEFSPDHIVLLDEEFTVQYQSPSSPLYELDPVRVEGENPLEYIHPEDRERVRDFFEELLANPGETIPAEFRARDASGEWRWVESHAINLLEEGPVDGVLAVVRDVTRQKRQRRELGATKQRLDAILEHTTTPMFMKDDEYRYVFVNRGYREVFGVEGEITGKTAHDVHPPERADRIEEDDRRVLENEEHFEFEERVTLDGETRTFLTTVVPVYGTGSQSDAGPDAVFGVASDITALKRRERELERERDRLEDFASIVSHDLRSPLNVASTRLELAAEECENPHLPDAAEALDRMDELIDDLLMLAREGEPARDLEAVALGDVCEACWVTSATANASLVLETDLRVRADRSRLRQLLENLMRNAVEHGGPDVTITVGETDDGIYVADDGPGIPESEREEVFEAGYSTKAGSTGLGLNITEEIVRAHGWDISITDSDDGGVRFEITGVDAVE